MRPGSAPKPAHLKLLEGNPGKRRIPTNELRPDPGPMPVPPPWLSPHGRAEWDRIAEQCYRLGLLTEVDVSTFIAYCQAYGRWVSAEIVLARMADGHPYAGMLVAGPLVTDAQGNRKSSLVKNPLVSQAAAAARDMVKYATEFGLTPAARTRIAAAETEAPKSRFDGLV